MIINTEQLAKKVAECEGENVATVRRIMSRIENTIYDYLSLATPTENVTVKLLNGLHIKGNYIPETKCKDPRNQDDVIASARIRGEAKLTRSFNNRINEKRS